MKKFNIKFYQHRKIFFCISLGLFVIGLLCNLIFGVELDIDFRDGCLLLRLHFADRRDWQLCHGCNSNPPDDQVAVPV